MPVNLSAMLSKHMGDSDRLRITPETFREQTGPANSAKLVRTIPNPSAQKLPMSQDFNRNLFSAILPAGVGQTVVPVEFTLPPTFIGWLQIFGIYILTPTALQDITFTLRINGGPVEGFDNIQFPPGVANFVVQNFADLQVEVPDGAKIDVLITNNSVAGPWTVGAKISGWYHPSSEARRIFGSL